MDELRQLFGEFLDRAGIAVLNLDDPETARLAAALPPEVRRLTYGFTHGAGLRGGYVAEGPLAISFEVTCRGSGETFPHRLKVLGRQNALNTLGGIAATTTARTEWGSVGREGGRQCLSQGRTD